MRNETQVIVTAMASDGENQMDAIALIGASAALAISDIPWGGPIAATTIGFVDGGFVVNPTAAQMETSSLYLVAAGTDDHILMVEAGAHESPEDETHESLKLPHETNTGVIAVINQMVADLGKAKQEVVLFVPSAELKAEVATVAADRVLAALEAGGKKADLHNALDAIAADVKASFAERVAAGAVQGGDVSDAMEAVVKKVTRQRILQGVRPDGRTTTTIRPISVQVGKMPRVHGSGLFMRGETHVLTIATLGTPGDAQKLDTLLPGDEKRYMHHYNFPPYSVGEAYAMRGPQRREIGHGALAARAPVPGIPADFAYTVRLVS